MHFSHIRPSSFSVSLISPLHFGHANISRSSLLICMCCMWFCCRMCSLMYQQGVFPYLSHKRQKTSFLCHQNCISGSRLSDFQKQASQNLHHNCYIYIHISAFSLLLLNKIPITKSQTPNKLQLPITKLKVLFGYWCLEPGHCLFGTFSQSFKNLSMPISVSGCLSNCIITE